MTFQWDTISGATGYELQIDDKSTFITPVLDSSGISGSHATAFVRDGDYHWRVRARGSDSVWGDWASARAFSVVSWRIVGRLQTRGFPQDLQVRGNYAFVADGQSGLSIYDVSDPASPVYAASIMDTVDYAYGLALAGNYAYLAYGRKQIQIVRIANFDSLALLGSIGYTVGYGYGIATLDTSYAIVANHGKTSFIDVRDPSFPILLYEPHATSRGVTLVDSLAYQACEYSGLMLTTFSAGQEPVTHSVTRTMGQARGVAVRDNYAYVADGKAGLTILDVSDRNAPFIVSNLDLPGTGYANKVILRNNLALIANGVDGFAAVDISDPAAPVLQSVLRTTETRAITMDSTGRVYLGDRDWGLLVLQKVEE